MLVTKGNSSIVDPLPMAVATGADADTPMTLKENSHARKWRELIDYQLIDWGRDPSQLDEEGTKTPSKRTILRAIELGTFLYRQGLPAPSTIVPDAHGSIVFERRRNDVFESIRISEIGLIDYCLFEKSRLVQREAWAIPSDNNT